MFEKALRVFFAEKSKREVFSKGPREAYKNRLSNTKTLEEIFRKDANFGVTQKRNIQRDIQEIRNFDQAKRDNTF